MFVHTDFPYWYHKEPFGSGHGVLKDRIFAAFMEHNGDMQKVFKALGVTSFTYYKYVRWLGIGVQLQAMREAMFPNKAFAGRKYSDEKPKEKPAPAIGRPRSVEDSGVWS